MTRVLLTGATGFIGGQVADLLAESELDFHACAIERGSEPAGATWHQVDLLDDAATKDLIGRVRPTHLLHLAWHSYGPGYTASPESARWVSASASLLRAFAEAGGERAVVAGSCFEYGSDDGVCTEFDTPLTPATPYGACKRALHAVAEEIAAGSGIGLAWARIFFVFGPREHPDRLVPAVIAPLLRGEPALTSEGSQRRDYIYSGEVASALTAIATSNLTGPVNVGSGEAVSVSDLVTEIAARIGREDLVRMGAVERKDDTPLIVASTARLKDELGWSPALSRSEGIDRTIEWWRSHLAGEGGATAQPAGEGTKSG